MTKPPTHTLPSDAFRADRGTTDACGSMYVEPPEQFTRRDPGSDHDTIELRLSRLESETTQLRKMIVDVHRGFAPVYDAIGDLNRRVNPEPTEPNPEPVTAGEGEKWKRMKNYAIEIDHDADMGWEQHCRLVIAKAVGLGLVVSPSDPRLQQIVATYDTFEAAYAAWEDAPDNLMYKPLLDNVVDAVVAHINAQRAPVAEGDDSE